MTGNTDGTPHVVIIDRAGFDRYRLPDGSPVVSPRDGRVSLLTGPPLVGQPRAGECARVLGYDIDDLPSTRAMLRTLHAMTPIDRLVCFPENLLILAAEERERLGLPGPRIGYILPFRDKWEMKTLASAAGIPVADWAAVERPEDVRPLLEKHGKVVVKPRGGTGSAGVYIVDGPERLAALPADLAGSQAEQFIDAPMIHIDAVVSGRAVAAARTSRYLDTTLAHVERQPLRSVISEDSALNARADALLAAAVDAFRVVDGVLHLEAFATADGLVFNEVACRPGGAGVVPLMQAVTGLNLYEAMVRQALDEKPTADYPITAGTGGWILLYADAGILAGIDDAAVPSDWIVERRSAVPIGGSFTPTGRAGGSVVSYVVRADSEAQAVARLEFIRDNVTVEVTGSPAAAGRLG